MNGADNRIEDDEDDLFEGWTEQDLAEALEWKMTPIELRQAWDAGLISMPELKDMRGWDEARARAELISRAEAAGNERFVQLLNDLAEFDRRRSRR